MITFILAVGVVSLIMGNDKLAVACVLALAWMAAANAREAHRHTHELGCAIGAPGAAKYCEGWD